MPTYVYARVCVEVDLVKGILEAIKLSLDGWTHVQQLDYEQLPFKCKSFLWSFCTKLPQKFSGEHCIK